MLLTRLHPHYARKIDANNGGDVDDAELVCSYEITPFKVFVQHIEKLLNSGKAALR